MTSVDQIEQMVLNGICPSDSSAGRRLSLSSSRSGDNSDVDADLYENDAKENENISPMDHSSLAPRSGPNTGVKGVRNDAARHAAVQNAIKRDQVLETNRRMENMALGTYRTWEEDEADRKREAEEGFKPGQVGKADIESNEEDEELRIIRLQRLAVLKSQGASNNARKQRMLGADSNSSRSRGSSPGRTFGHLREIDAEHYANAIDGEDKDVTVVIHIYVKYIHSCSQLTSTLSILARMHTDIKFLQIKAASIGFGSGGKDANDEMQAEEAAEEIVPTLLVYKAGQLIANLVRVDLEEDWRAGEEHDIRSILKRHGVQL